jgi:hypothetical protein
VDVEDVSVNGVMVSAAYLLSGITVTHPPQSYSMGWIAFSVTSLHRAGITDIKEFGLVLVARDANTGKEVARSSASTVRTRAYDAVPQELDSSGTIVHDSDGVKIVAKGLGTTIAPEWMQRTIIPVYIENNTDQDFHFLVGQLTVNRAKAKAFLTATVCAGKKGYFDIVLSRTGLEGDKTGKAMEVTFSIHGYAKGKKLFAKKLDTSPVTLVAAPAAE